MDQIRRFSHSTVDPMSTRPFDSSPLSIVDQVRQPRPKLTHNQQIIEKKTKMKKVQFEGIHSHYRDRDQRTLNEYIDQYKRQDLAAK